MMVELTNCTETLLREIADKRFKRRNVAKTYALALRSSEETDWGTVNRAIIDRWSFSALEWIKWQAWSGRCFEGGDAVQARADEMMEELARGGRR
jgi:hypothetical protein